MAEPMWQHPDPKSTQMDAFRRQIQSQTGLELSDYAALHQWSVENPEAFWRACLVHCQLKAEGDIEPAMRLADAEQAGPGLRATEFFPKLRMNFASNLLRHAEARAEEIAIVSLSQTRERVELSFGQLRQRVHQLAAFLHSRGVQPKDRVAGMVPNVTEAIIAMLATTQLGAIWSSCSPDFGIQGVLDRFGQIDPKVLLVVDGYKYGAKAIDCQPKTAAIVSALQHMEGGCALQTVIQIGYLDENAQPAPVGDAIQNLSWNDALRSGQASIESDGLAPAPMLPFEHPLYIMYSSGTTGVPKCIVHGAGGTLLQHAKELILHADLKTEDRIFYFTTCGWMMWNWLVSSLFTGARVIVFDGAPLYPGPEALWRMAEQEGVTHFGTSPKFLSACADQQTRPNAVADLSRLRVLMSTGAPLLPEQFDWVYEQVSSTVQLASISGGTDIISCFALGCPTVPVRRGELQVMGLGMDVAAFNDAGQPCMQEQGELVCRKPFVSMPIGFWNDTDHRAFSRAYFEGFEGVWTHGDYIEVTGSVGQAGGIVVYGRSDTTLNPGGVRIGTAEIYRIVEAEAGIQDSLVVGLPKDGDVEVVLFVVAEYSLESSHIDALKKSIRAQATPRHVPARIHQVPAVPYTISGKKVELAAKQVLMGKEPKNKAALANPEALDAFRAFV